MTMRGAERWGMGGRWHENNGFGSHRSASETITTIITNEHMHVRPYDAAAICCCRRGTMGGPTLCLLPVLLLHLILPAGRRRRRPGHGGRPAGQTRHFTDTRLLVDPSTLDLVGDRDRDHDLEHARHHFDPHIVYLFVVPFSQTSPDRVEEDFRYDAICGRIHGENTTVGSRRVREWVIMG